MKLLGGIKINFNFVNFHEFDFYDYQKSASFYIDQFNRDVGFLQLDENSTPSRKWFKSIKNALNHLFDGCYDIGMHMTYTILFMDRNITVAKLTEFTPHRFVRKYENCMILRKEKPVFSLTSGNGTLDYKELVHFLCKAATIK